MGWFWSDSPVSALQPDIPSQHAFARQEQQHHQEEVSPPPGCPMHKRTVDALSSSSTRPRPPTSPGSSCPIPHGAQSAPAQPSAQPAQQQNSSLLSRINPLNYMFHTISQAPAPEQTQALPTMRDESSIPRGSGEGNWEYPSPQQMYNALLRKGYTDTDITAVESMVAVHNFLNEGAWAEIVEWERRFAGGLARGWQVSKRGEANAPMELRSLEAKEGPDAIEKPTLIRFEGRPNDMTPRAAMLQALGWLYPSKYGTEPPFDRHDWYVSRCLNGKQKQVRYVIDYYSGPPEPTGEPVFYLDVRPAMTVSGAAERLLRWGGDVWWRASGAEVRQAKWQGQS